jgi:hypothetical protein
MRLVQELRIAGLAIGVTGGSYIRRHGAAVLPIGAKDLARSVVRLTRQQKQLAIVGTIRRMARNKKNPRLVMAMCQQYAGALRGRRGFSALRLYNLYYAVNRRLRKADVKR